MSKALSWVWRNVPRVLIIIRGGKKAKLTTESSNRNVETGKEWKDTQRAQRKITTCQAFCGKEKYLLGQGRQIFSVKQELGSIFFLVDRPAYEDFKSTPEVYRKTASKGRNISGDGKVKRLVTFGCITECRLTIKAKSTLFHGIYKMCIDII